MVEINTVMNEIDNADFLIIGIGEKFGYDFKLLEKDERYVELYDEIMNRDDSLEWIIPFLQKVVMDNNPEQELVEAYRILSRLIENKDAYVITTTIDDYVFQSGIPKDRIVTPCGGFRRLQCEKACSNEIINLPKALLQYVQKLYNNTIGLDEMVDKYPECPQCGANLVFNQIGIENYVEADYLINWARYREWLEKTMNKKTVLIELGAGLGFMSVIRNPFERLVSYNLKSTLYRVHPSLYMGIPEMGERCVSVQADPKEWIQGLIED